MQSSAAWRSSAKQQRKSCRYSHDKSRFAVDRDCSDAGQAIHEYFGVDLEIVWETVRNDLVSLESAIRKILEEAE